MSRWGVQASTIILALLMASVVQAIDLKTYYQDGYPKYFTVTEGGKQEVVGLCVDIMRLLEQKDPEIRFITQNRLVTFKRIKNDLQNGTIDVFLGMTHTPERDTQFVYVRPPLYEVNHVVAVRRVHF